MTGKEHREVSVQMQNIYSGILFQNRNFAQGEFRQITYTFDCPEFALLRSRYPIETMAGQGSDFVRARRLMHKLAPRLTHSSWYDNHIVCNALQLLEYSLDNPKQGINCLNKAKILQECCLALGIYARRVRILPFSPYDFDNHVVTEIYDRGMQKWIMLDPTTDGYFIDGQKTPLSLLEMRELFAQASFITFRACGEPATDLEKLRRKHAYTNAYICKNLCWFQTEKESGFGVSEEMLTFVPRNFSVRDTNIANATYRIRNLPEDYSHLRETFEARLETLQKSEETVATAVESLTKAPF